MSWFGPFALFPYLCKSLPGDEELLPLPVRSGGAAGTCTFHGVVLKAYWDRVFQLHFFLLS